MLKTTITKKAAAIIATFSNREKSLYETGIEYISEDMQHIVKCNREITVYENNTPDKYHAAIKNQTNMTFRAKYFLQCLGLYVYDNFETMGIEVKTISDK